MKWIVADSLYCPEQFFASHLDSYAHYLRAAGEDVWQWCLNHHVADIPRWDNLSDPADFTLVLDQYDFMWKWGGGLSSAHHGKWIAQVAARVPVMPWEVRKADGSPAYDLVLSSIPSMVDEARAAGCRAELQALCFDHRALVAGMNVRERDIPCLFLGSVDVNHQKRAAILRELGDLVTVAPPTFGRAYYELIARAKVLVHVQANWGQGCRNSLRYYEGAGLGALVIGDGKVIGDQYAIGWWAETADVFKERIERALRDETERSEVAEIDHAHVLAHETYIQRVPEIISMVRSL